MQGLRIGLLARDYNYNNRFIGNNNRHNGNDRLNLFEMAPGILSGYFCFVN